MTVPLRPGATLKALTLKMPQYPSAEATSIDKASDKLINFSNC